MRSDDAVYALLTLLPVMLVLGLLVRKLFRPVAVPQDLPRKDGPWCVACGEVATHAMPRLARGRGSAIEDYFGMPPRYRRVVPAGAALTLCQSHAGVADGELASFVAVEVRAPFLRASAQVAARVAAFEAEELLARVGASLTEAQRKAAKRGSAGLRLVQKNGTEE